MRFTIRNLLVAFALANLSTALPLDQKRAAEEGDGPGGICFGGCHGFDIKRDLADPFMIRAAANAIERDLKKREEGDGPGGICFGGCHGFDI